MVDFIQRFNNILGQTSQAIGVADQVGDLLGVPGIGSRIFGSQSPRAQFSINTFNAAINRYNGLLKSSLFLARIAPPATLSSSLSQDLIMFCDNANLPSLQMATDDIVRHGYGPQEKMPYKPLFGDIQLGFLGDGLGMTHKFFQDWINSIVSFDLSKGFSSYDSMGKSPFEVEYKENYQGGISLCTYNERQQNIIEIEVFEAFPIAIDHVQLNWNNTNDLMRIDIRFGYTYYNAKSSEPQIVEGLGSNFFQMIQKGATIAQTVSTIKKPQSIGDVSNVLNNANIIKRGVFGTRL